VLPIVKVEIGGEKGLCLEDFLVNLAPGRIDNAKKNQLGIARVFDPLDASGGYFDGVTSLYICNFVIDMHLAGPFEDVVHLVGLHPVPDCLVSRIDNSMGKRIATVESVLPVRVQEFAKAGVVACGYLVTVFKFTYQHVVLTRFSHPTMKGGTPDHPA